MIGYESEERCKDRGVKRGGEIRRGEGGEIRRGEEERKERSRLAM